MDFVGGREMFEQLCDNGPYSEADAARHVRETASALAFLHGIGIIHTDVKPENCLLSSKETSDAVIKVVDLGCAHRVGVEPTHEQRLKGTANTPAYCPPEVLLESQERQHHDKLHSHVTIAPPFDMWSLGVVIYTMLVGAHPYDLRGDGMFLSCFVIDIRVYAPTHLCDGQTHPRIPHHLFAATDEEIARKIMSGKKPPLRNFKYARHLSEDAMSLIEGLMETDPTKRLTADQVLENPWVLGETASHKAIANSDRRLAEQHRKCKTKIGSTFFKTLLSQTDAIHGNSTTERAPVLELAFRRLDTDKSGYLSTGGGDCAKSKLSLSDVSSLLAENMKNRYFSKSHVIYKEGQEGDSMYLISSGTVELTTKDGFVKTRGSGEIFGEDIMSKSKVHSSTVECKTPVHVLEIPRELYEKYVASDRETFLSMAETDRHRRRERASTILNLNKQCRSQSFKKGDAIFQEGQKGNKLYMLQDGHVDITVHGHKVRSLKIGEMTGEHAAYHYKPYNVTATCLSDSCEMRVLPSRVMHRLFKSDPSLREDFRELMMRRDFKKAVCTAIGKPFPTSHEEIQAAFQAIDKDKSGEISFEELKELVLRFDPTYNEEDIQYMHESLDLSNTQQVTWEEFRRIFAMDKEA
jgi:serine/threonine protein kinase